MAVIINVHSIEHDISTPNNDVKFAKDLAERFKQEFAGTNVSGRINLYTNFTYGGGETSEADILLVVDIENYSKTIYTSVTKTNIPVNVQRGCWIIELKGHGADCIVSEGNQLLVPYTNPISKKTSTKPISTQSRKQRFDIANYFNGMLGYSPFIDNYLCLTRVSQKDLSRIIQKSKISNVSLADNYLSCDFTFEELVRKTAIYRLSSVVTNHTNTQGWMNCCSHQDSMFSDIEDLITARKVIVGDLTQQKMNLLSLEKARESTNNVLNGQSIGLLQGRAGTGKTIRLLQMAVDIENLGESGNRCLVLTYNHALVADIRRTLFLTGHYGKIQGKVIDVQTLHSFFLNLLYHFDVRKDKTITDPHDYFAYGGKYYKELEQLWNVIKDQDNDILDLYKEEDEWGMNWDYVFVDEGQDWSDIEVRLLTKIYGLGHIVVADGVDQFVRGTKKLDVKTLFGKKNVNEKKSQKSLRQKTALTSFVNTFAVECSMDWSVKESDMPGGHIYFMKGYGSNFHNDLVKQCKKAKADNYDILFLVPPQDVIDKPLDPHFVKYDTYKSANILLFDGTTKMNRTRYSVNSEECRLYQYESCRGLEGWAVVCYDFDLFIEAKMEQFEKENLCDPNLPATLDEQKKMYAYQWALMPLTRPIDTLIITFSDENSEVAKTMKRISTYKLIKDSITWIK